MQTSQRESIAEACGHLNDVGLPNVLALMRTLEALASVVALDPYMASDPRLTRAQKIIHVYKDHL